MAEKDELRTVIVKLEDYAGSLESYWAREEGYFLSGRFSHSSPNLVMRIPMCMPKRLDGSGFVDIEHWFDFYPFVVSNTSMIPSHCEKARAIAGKFETRSYNGRLLNTFTIQPPKRAPHLLVGPITMPHAIDRAVIENTLRPSAVYLHPITISDGTLVSSCFVVIRFGERIDPSLYAIKQGAALAKHDRKVISQEYEDWLLRELMRTDTCRLSLARLANTHRRSSQKFIRALADLETMLKTINDATNRKHVLTQFPGGAIYDGELYFEKQDGLKQLSDLIHKQFSDTLQAAENAKEVIRIIKCLDVDNYLTYLHLDLIQSPTFASFILRNSSSCNMLCSYTYGSLGIDDYGELLSVSPNDLAEKIWKHFLPIVLDAVVRFEQLKALQACDRSYSKKHPRATRTRVIEPNHFL